MSDTSCDNPLIVVLQQAQDTATDGGWMTTLELAERLGLNEKATRSRLRVLFEQGRLQSAWVVRPNMAGAQQRRPAYRLRQDNETPAV